jgi:predicted NAD-dependent protein-ADP-ribosyltransferase YbiA (DUF1768 family)
MSDRINDPILPIYQSTDRPIPGPIGNGMPRPVAIGGTTPRPKEGLFTGGYTSLDTLPSTGRYPVFFRGIDNEEAYAQGQGIGEKWLNASVKLGGLAAATFIDGTLGLVYGAAKWMEDGKFSSFYNNELTNKMDEFNKNWENQFAHYITRKEKDAEWYEPDNLFTANFWSNTLFKNIGFALGAAASGGAWTRAFEALGLFSKAAATGNIAKAALAAEQAALAAPASQGLTAVKSALANVAKSFASQYKSATNSHIQRGLTSLLMTAGEASIEALEGMNVFRQEAINSFIQENGRRPIGEELDRINKLSEGVGNTRFLLNTALLTVTNFIQLPKILGSSYKNEKNLFHEFVKPTNKIARDAAKRKYSVVKPTKLDKLTGVLRAAFSPSEAFEEGMQFAIDKGVENYWSKRLRNEDTSFITDMLGKGVEELLTSPEGWESIFIGGVTGGIMETARGISRRDSKERRANTASAVEAFNKSYIYSILADNVKHFNIAYKTQQEREQAIKNGDFFSAKELEQDFLHSFLAPRVKWGKFDLVNEELNELKAQVANPESFAKMVQEGTLPEGISQADVLNNINKLQSNAKTMAEAYETLNVRYGGLVDEDGNRLYSDEVIDKMVYANSKIQDIDRRIPLVNGKLAGANISMGPALDEITNIGDISKETQDKIKEDIAKLQIIDEEKVTLTEAANDLVKLSKRRQVFINEYNDLRKNPEKHRDAEEEKAALSKQPIDKQILKIKTKKGERDIEVGTEYFLGRVVEYDEKGNEVYRMPIIKVLGQNEDGTYKVQGVASGEVKNVTASQLEDYALGKVSDLKKNKTANYFANHWNDVYQYNFGKGSLDKKRKGRLEYNSEEDKLFFTYLDYKGRRKSKELKREHFITQPGFYEARIKIMGRLSAYTDAQRAADKAFFEQSQKEKENIERQMMYDERRKLLSQIIADAEQQKTSIQKSIFDKKEQIKKLQEQLENAVKNRKSTKVFLTVRGGFRKLTTLKFKLEQEVAQLEGELEELEFNLSYYNDMVSNIGESSPDLETFLSEIIAESNSLAKLIDEKSKFIREANELIKHSRNLINKMLSLINKLKTEPSSELDETIKQIKSSGDYTLEDDVKVQALLDEVSVTEQLIADANRDIKNEEQFISDLIKDLDPYYKEVAELSAQWERVERALVPLRDAAGSYLRERAEIKKKEEAFKEKKDLLDQIFISQKQIEAFAGEGLPPDDEEGEKRSEEKENSKPSIRRIAHTTFNEKNIKEYNKREQRFLSNLDKRSDRELFKVVPVTENNEKSLGLEGVTKDALSGYAPSKGQEPILFVYVKKEGDSWVFVDENGDTVQKIDTDTPAPKDKIVYGMSTTSSLESYGELKYHGENQEEFSKAWEEERQKILKETEGVPYNFEVSRGIPEKESGAMHPVTKILPEGTNLSKEGLVVIATTEGVAMPSGEVVNVPKGRMMLRNGASLSWLNNRRLTSREKNVIKQLLKQLTIQLTNKPAEFDRLITSYLQGILYFSSPYDVEGKKKTVGRNQIWFENGNWVMGNGEVTIPFISESFERPETQKVIDAFLDEVFIGANKSKLRDSFIEILGIKEDGTFETKEWPTYQEFLISPEGRTPSEIPLTTHVIGFKNRYSWLPSVTENIKVAEKKSPIKEASKPATPTSKAATPPTNEGEIVLAQMSIDELMGGKSSQNPPEDVPPFIPDDIPPFEPSSASSQLSGFAAAMAAIAEVRKKVSEDAAKSQPVESPKPETDEPKKQEPPQATQDEAKEEFRKRLEAAKQARKEGKGPDPGAQNKVVLNTDVVVGDMQKEMQYISERINVPVSVVKELIKNLQGGYSWGQFRDGAIYLYEKAEVGTGYHEAFEAVWAMFTSLQEKKNIYSEFRSRKGTFVDRESGKKITFQEASEYQIKEQLAEEFAVFVHFGQNPPKASKNFIQRFFAALKNFIKNVILGQVVTPQQLFERIDKGYYKNAKLVNTSGVGEQNKKIAGLSEIETNLLVKSTTSKLFIEIFSDTSNTSLIEFEESGKGVKELYDKVFQTLDDFYNSETGLLNALLEKSEVSGNPVTEDQMFAIWNVWNTAKQNWPQIVDLSLEMLKTFGLVTKTVSEQSSDLIDNEEQIEFNREEEENELSDRNDSYLRDVFKYDAKLNAPASVKLLLATIVDSEFFGRETLSGGKQVRPTRDNALALEEMVNYAKMFNNTLAEMSDKNTIDEKLEHLKTLGNKFPNYYRLVRRLGLHLAENQVDADTWKLRIKAFSTFSKQRPTAYIYTIDTEGNGMTIPANQESGRRILIQSWIDELKLRSGKEHNAVKYDSKKKGYFIEPRVLKTLPVKTFPEQQKFLSVLGIDFSNEAFNNLSYSEKTELANSVQSIYNTLTKGEVIVGKYESLKVNTPLRKIADLLIKSLAKEPESTFFNIEGERVQEFILPNLLSNTVNDINNAANIDDLYNRLPYLQQLWHQGSYYIGTGKDLPKFETEYIQGVRDLADEFRPNKPITKLNEAERLLQEINQNFRGSYYVLVPADNKTEWMLKMKNPIAYEGISTIGWANLYSIFEKYYSVEQQLFKIDGKKRLLFDFGGYVSPFDKDSFKESIEKSVNDQIELLSEFRYIRKLSNDKYKVRGFETEILEKFGIGEKELTQQELETLILYRTMNYVVNNVEMHKLFFGDPAAFGSIENMVKRYKSFLSPRQTSVYGSSGVNNFLDEEYNTAGEVKLTPNIPGYQRFKDFLKTVTLSDVKISGLYDESNSTDGQSWATLAAYREIRMKAGFNWTQKDETQYQYIQAADRLAMFEDGLFLEKDYPKELRKQDREIVKNGDPKISQFAVLKPIGTGFSTDLNVFLDKTSIVPLSYTLTRGKNIGRVYKKMLDEGIDYIIAKSGRKVGAQGEDSFYNEKGELNLEQYKSVVNVPFRYYGIQVETTNSKDSQTRGSQLTKLAILNLIENGEVKDPKNEELVTRHTQILREMAKNGYERLLDKLGIVDTGESFEVVDKEKMVNLVNDELTRREVTDNIRDVLKLNPETDDLVIPFEALNNYEQIKNILFSFIDKMIASPKLSGGPKIQVSGALWEELGVKEVITKKGKKVLVSSGLKFYEDEEGKRHIEVYLPSWVNDTLRREGFEWNSPEELMELLKESPDFKEIISGIGFRIPTQEINSAEVFVIKGFLPDSAGDTVVVPEEITTKAGSDFDVDKLNTYLKNIYVDGNGQIRTVKYFDSLEEHESFYKEEFKKILFRKFEINEKNIEKQGNLQTLFGELVAGNLPSKKAEKWNNIFREWFGHDATAIDIENIYMEKLISLGKTKDFLTNMDKQQALLWKFIDKMREKSLENEYYNTLEKILTLPENFERLTSPNSTETLIEIRDILVDINPEVFGEGVNKSILNPMYMSRVRHNFIVGKGGVGIAAVAQTGAAIRQLSKVIINPSLKDKVKDSRIKMDLGDLKINLPHNTVNINGRDFVSLSGSKDRAGVYISQKISEYINGFVDIAKDAFITMIGATTDQAGTFLFLESIGVPSKTVAYFMNQPIIRRYNELYKRREAGEFRTDIIDKLEREFRSDKKELPKELVEGDPSKVEEYLLTNIKNFYSKDKKSIDNSHQLAILEEYFKYSALSRQLFDFTQGTNYDTSRFTDSNLVLRKELAEEKARTEGVISSVDDFMKKSFLGEMKNSIVNSSNAISSIFKFDHPSIRRYFRGVVADLAKNTFSVKDFLKAARKVESSFINYMIMTSPGGKKQLMDRINELLIQESTSLAAELSNIKRIKGDLNKNLVLSELVPVVGANKNSVKNVKLINKAFDIFTSNLYTSALRELRDNPHTQALYGKIVRVSFLQSGISRSPISFGDVIPVEDYSKVIQFGLDALGNTQILENFAKIGAFERANWRDDNIVPVGKDRIGYDDFDNPYWKDRFYPKEILEKIPNIESRNDYLCFKVHHLARNFNSKFIKVSVLNGKYDSRTIREMKKNQDFSYMTTYLLRRVDFSDGTPATKIFGKAGEYAIFVPVNAWGKGIELQEYYSEARPSAVDNNTYKPPFELSNEQITNMLGLTSVDGQRLVNQITNPPSSKPLSAPTSSTVSESNTPEKITSLKPKENRVIAIIGTAGRTKVPTINEWNNMLKDAELRVKPQDTLISGGAAFADHIAVKLFLEGKVKGLKLRLPAKIKNGKFVGGKGTAGGTAQYYHENFSKLLGVDTVAEIEQAIEKGAEATYETEISNKAMFIRNEKVANESNAMIAYTYGEGNQPADGGTKDTWNKSKYADKTHVQIDKIGIPFDAALTPSQPLIQEKMETVPEINIYAGTNENADLSNFAIRPFKFQVQPIVSDIYGEKSFDSVEQAFQWHKGLFAEAPAQFGGSGSKTVQIMRQIKETRNGADIKKLGRQYILKNTKAWDSYSSVLMKDLLKASFEQNPQALQRLLSTGNAKLTHTQDKSKWGTEFPKLLMEVREELRNKFDKYSNDNPFECKQK